jgi:hypothetical protein
VQLQDGRVLVVGGSLGAAPRGGRRVPTAQAALYDPSARRWRAAVPMG